ncbi:DUF2861 family protein [Dongshaea marina]|uniref:DUF2861 family protein n=1 Tax=Dongshaea marina TaxID=2047966 RepID=UPI000D3ED2C0|nr:DUF2861 family protein [Dongshaea marina]
MNIRMLLLVFSLLPQAKAVAQNSWIAPSPLQGVYESLLKQQPTQAWQQLTWLLAQPVSQTLQHEWPKAYQILSQTSRCGRDLPSVTPSHQLSLKLILIHSQGFNHSSYRLKFAIEGGTQLSALSCKIIRGKTGCPVAQILTTTMQSLKARISMPRPGRTLHPIRDP